MSIWKKILFNALGCFLFLLVGGIVLGIILDDNDLAFSLCFKVILGYVFILSFISLIKKLSEIINASNKERIKGTAKASALALTIFPYITLWGILVALAFKNILNIALTISFISLAIYVILFLILGSVVSHEEYKEENKEDYSKDIYKKQNGRVYYVLSIIAFIFFVYGLSVIIRSVLNVPLLLELGDFSVVMGCICIIGIIGFPLVLIINEGMKRLYAKSQLKIEDGKIVYVKQAEFEWTAAGHVNEKHYYTINKIDSYTISNRWFEILGDIDKEEINNGRSLGTKKVSSVKIARAFKSDSEIIKLLKN